MSQLYESRGELQRVKHVLIVNNLKFPRRRHHQPNQATAERPVFRPYTKRGTDKDGRILDVRLYYHFIDHIRN